MARPNRPWFRFYTEALSDRKLRRLTPAQRWLWVAVLGAARMSPISGYLVLSVRASMDEHDLADIAGMTAKEVAVALPLFEKAGMLEWDDNIGAWFVTKWADRQYESDDVTQRTRKHRAKERSIDVPGNVPSLLPGTPPETETETETEVGGNRLVVAPRATRLEPATRTRILRETADEIATMRGVRGSGKGGAYIAAAVKGITEDIHDQVHDLLSEHPEWTAGELAQRIEHPPRPSAFPTNWPNTLSGTVREEDYV